ncbi:hypothetical protein BC941DRAFT_518443 [Chlamydoabsidia padenii]|nr:hypothetical protein BC941DRAFT_518443 [Chlamydoabsidia padenii]
MQYLCDHAGAPEKKKFKTLENKRRKTVKVECTIKITKYTSENGKVKAIYNWMHKNQDPREIEDIASSRLPLDIHARTTTIGYSTTTGTTMIAGTSTRRTALPFT